MASRESFQTGNPVKSSDAAESLEEVVVHGPFCAIVVD
jgi:hypothetical protein